MFNNYPTNPGYLQADSLTKAYSRTKYYLKYFKTLGFLSFTSLFLKVVILPVISINPRNTDALEEGNYQQWNCRAVIVKNLENVESISCHHG